MKYDLVLELESKLSEMGDVPYKVRLLLPNELPVICKGLINRPNSVDITLHSKGYRVSVGSDGNKAIFYGDSDATRLMGAYRTDDGLYVYTGTTNQIVFYDNDAIKNTEEIANKELPEDPFVAVSTFQQFGIAPDEVKLGNNFLEAVKKYQEIIDGSMKM